MRKSHGHTTNRSCSPTYASWEKMIQRCTNPNDPKYVRYGGRGIKVCDRWLTFKNFLADMGEQPKGLTLERKNNDESYSPLNCKWETLANQARNRHTNCHIEIAGRTQCLAAWCEEYKINRKTVMGRVRVSGLSWIEALTKPLMRTNGLPR